MGPFHFFFPLILISQNLFAQDAITDWFPQRVGDTWVYNHTTRDEHGNGRAHPDVHTWKTEETIVDSWPVPEGTLVEKSIRIIEGSPRGTVGRSDSYLIRGNCVYAEYGAASFDARSHPVAAEFRKALDAGQVSPDLCFPLTLHKKWGAPHGLPDWNVARPEDAKDWEVVEIRAHDPTAPDGRPTYHIRSISGYAGAGITVDVWFAKGIGIVRSEAIHHGTLGEQRIRLLRFKAAAR